MEFAQGEELFVSVMELASWVCALPCVLVLGWGRIS